MLRLSYSCLTAASLLALGSAATAQTQAVRPGHNAMNSGMNSNLGAFPGMLPGQVPGLNAVGQMGISPQMQQYMMLRGLQGMGHHHGVHTGYMDPIIGAGPQFDPTAMWMNNGGGMYDAGRMSSSDRRAAARAAREEQRHLARERAEKNKAVKPTGKAKFSAK